MLATTRSGLVELLNAKVEESVSSKRLKGSSYVNGGGDWE